MEEGREESPPSGDQSIRSSSPSFLEAFAEQRVEGERTEEEQKQKRAHTKTKKGEGPRMPRRVEGWNDRNAPRLDGS